MGLKQDKFYVIHDLTDDGLYLTDKLPDDNYLITGTFDTLFEAECFLCSELQKGD
jgi:hypothetical protein